MIKTQTNEVPKTTQTTSPTHAFHQLVLKQAVSNLFCTEQDLSNSSFFKMSISPQTLPRSIAGLTPPELAEVVSRFDHFAYSGCQCVFSDECLVCQNMSKELNLVHDLIDCQVCAAFFHAAPSQPIDLVTDSFDHIMDFPVPEVPYQEVMLRVANLGLKLIHSGPHPFNVSTWSPTLFSGYTTVDLKAELHRPNFPSGLEDADYLDDLFYEVLQRGFSSDQTKYLYKVYVASRRRLQFRSSRKRTRSSGAKRAAFRAAPAPQRTVLPSSRSLPLVTRQPSGMPLPLLSGFIFPTQDPLYLGSFVVHTKEDLMLDSVQRVFSRNKPLLWQMLSSSEPVSSWQPLIFQKIQNDANFRHRIDCLIRSSSDACLDSFKEPDELVFQSAVDDSDFEMEDERSCASSLREDARIAALQIERSRFIDLTSVANSVPMMINGLELVNVLARLATTVNLIVNAPDFATRVKIMYLYVSAAGVQGLMDYVDALVATRHFQSGALETAFDQTLSLLGVANIFTLVTGTPVSMFTFLHKRFEGLAHRSDGDSLISKFWDALKSLLRAFSECFRVGSIDPLFSEGDTPTEILFEAEALLLYRNEITGLTHDAKADTIASLHKKKAIPSYWTRAFVGGEYHERIRVVVDKLDSCLPLVTQAQRGSYSSARARLFTFLAANINALASNGQRIQPLGVALVGDPGTGKSNLLRLMIRSIASREGFSDDASAVYFWKQDVNFQDGAKPTHWAYVADDIDNNCKGCAPGVKNHVDAILEVVDNKPFPLESADVAEKGTNYGRPLVLFYGSNFESLRLATFAPRPTAIKRRLGIKLVVRPATAFAQGRMLDPDKIHGDIDIHDIDIHVYDKTTDDYMLFKQNATTSEALRFIRQRFRANVESQTNFLAHDSISECVVCKIPIKLGATHCSECAPRFQGGNISTPVQDITVSAANVRLMSDKAVETQLVDKMDRVFSGLDAAISAPARAAASVRSSAKSFADFVIDNPALAAACSAAAMAITLYLATTGSSLQGRVNNSTQVAPIDFVRVSDVKPVGLAFKQTTWTREDVIKQVRLSIGEIFADGKRAHVLRVGLDQFVVNDHMVLGTILRVVYRGIEYPVRNAIDTVTRVGTKDLAILKIPGVPAQAHALPFFWQDQDLSYSTFDGLFLVREDEILEAQHNSIRHETMNEYSGYVVSSDMVTRDGDCGLPVVAVSGSHFRIIGIHHSQSRTLTLTGLTMQARAPLLSKGELMLAATQTCGSLQSGVLLMSCFPRGLVQEDLPPSSQSELALAIERGAEVVNLGHDRASVGFSASKSKCQHSPLYAELEPFCREVTDKPNYWQVPILKGKMVDGAWQSGYQRVFAGYDNTEAYSKMYYAILDYVEPFAHLDTQGYECLSLDEAIRGVDNSLIGPSNLRTSVGPPLGGPKSAHITGSGFVSPAIAAQVAEIYSILDAGDIPLALCNVSLKDEPVKCTKNETRDIRTICCLPASINLVAKQFLGPIKAFMRHNASVFESMVGINMAQDGGQSIYERFSLIDPSLNNIVEGDYRKMDKMINGTCAWAAVEVFGRIAEVLGLDILRVKSLVWAQFNVVYSIHGDLYQVGAANPSGCDLTVEINAVVNSLCQRAVWNEMNGNAISLNEYRERVPISSYFRSHNSLVTYGDDFLLAHRVQVDLPRFYAGFATVGHTVTDGGSKLGKPVYRSLYDCTFLKRRFFMVNGFIRCGLIEPSIYRMLMVLKPSKLSVKEQTAICCEEAIREVFLNSSLDFELWLTRLRGLADRHGLRDSAYLLLADKSVYEQMWQDRTFSTWDIPKSDFCAEQDLGTQLQSKKVFPFFDKMSSSIQTTSAMGDASQPSVVSATTTNLAAPSTGEVPMTPSTYGSMVAGGASGAQMSHASGNILSLTQPVIAGSSGNVRFNQPMADMRFADSLGRNVLATKFTDFTRLAEHSFQPWSTWAADPFVADKLANFTYIRGSMVVSGVLKAPPLAAGLVIVSFVPSYEPTSWTPVNPVISTVLPHVVVDLSTSSDFEMTLPWIVSSDWGNLSDKLYETYWTVQIRCISPMISGIPDGCASAQLTLFVRPGADFMLSGADYQSGRAHPRAPSRPAVVPEVMATPAFNAAKPRQPGGGVKPAPSAQVAVNDYSVSQIGMKPSEALAKIGKVGLGLSVIPVIGEVAGAIGAAATVASSWASWFGFTRESVVREPAPVLIASSQNVVNCDGDDHSQMAALFANNALNMDPGINGTLSSIDETSLAFINSRYSLIGGFQYVVGDSAPQDHLIPVTPCLGAFGVGDTTFVSSTAGYNSGKFAYWRGDVDFLFYPVMSAVHSGSLQFIWQPFPRSASVPVDMTNLSLNTIVELGPAQPIKIRVGYNNDNPMCATDFYALDTPLTLADRNTLNGYLRVRALNPITGSVCGQNIDVLVFVAAADNMEFAVPTEIVLIEGDPIVWGQGIDISNMLQSATVGSGGQNMVSVDLVPSTGEYPVADILAGEHVKSIRALISKPSVCWDLAPLEAGPTIPHYHGPFRANDPCNYFNYFGSQFLAFAGGVRYKTLVDAGFAVGVPTAITAVPSIQHQLGTQASLPTGQFNPTVNSLLYANEVCVPYYHNEKWTPAYKQGALFDEITWDITTPFQLRLATYKSAGPDARLTFFRAQNQFFFVSEDVPQIAVFQKYGFNGAVPSFAAISASRPSTDIPVVKQMTLDQYRARTGRSEFKLTSRSSARKSKKTALPPLVMEEQATREDVVA